VKQSFIQALIRIVISKEKYLYIKSEAGYTNEDEEEVGSYSRKASEDLSHLPIDTTSKFQYTLLTDSDGNMVPQTSLRCNNFEYTFLQNIISRSLILTRLKYGDNYTCLFRKDEVYDDIVKYFFFIFGNSLVIKSFSKDIILTP
jgi:hypothetical protein